MPSLPAIVQRSTQPSSTTYHGKAYGPTMLPLPCGYEYKTAVAALSELEEATACTWICHRFSTAIRALHESVIFGSACQAGVTLCGNPSCSVDTHRQLPVQIIQPSNVPANWLVLRDASIALLPLSALGPACAGADAAWRVWIRSRICP